MKLRFLDNLYDNPVFVREIRRRLRGRALVVAIIGYVLLMCSASFLTILIMYADVATIDNLPQKLRQITEIGRYIFFEVFALCGLLTLLIAPIMALNAVVMEKEKGTFDFIKVTTIRPGSFILGNFLSIMVYVFMIFVCALPIISLGFLFGGVAPAEIVKAFGLLLAYAVLLASAGLYLSVISEKMRLALARMFSIFVLIMFSMSFATYYVVPLFLRLGTITTPRYVSQFFGVLISPSVIGIVWTIVLVLLLLNAASRKLYNTERRPMSYWQFLVLFLLGLVTLWGYIWPTIDLSRVKGALLANAILFCLAVFIFSIGQVEVGDEVWRLKKRFKLLRKTDEGLYYVFALLLIAGATVVCWPLIAKGSTPLLTYTLYLSFALIAMVTLFYYQLGRVATAMGGSRRTGLRIVFATIVLLTLVIPIVSRFIHDIIKPQLYLKLLYSLNPIYSVDSFYNVSRHQGFWIEGGGQIAFYAFLFILLRILTIRWLKNKFPQYAAENLEYEFKDKGEQK